MSHHLEGAPVTDTSYKSLSSLTRSLHFPDFSSCYSSKTMIPRRISTGWRCHLSSVNEVLWFGPSLDSTYEHNRYGNVSFIVPMDALISSFGSDFYYVDKQEFSTHIASRVVLSKRALSLKKVDTGELGSPLRKCGYGHNSGWQHVSECRSTIYDKTLPHYLEIGIEVDSMACKVLYDLCTIQPNDHSKANSAENYGSKTCHRHNTFQQTCPFKLTQQEAQEKLEKEYPHYK